MVLLSQICVLRQRGGGEGGTVGRTRTANAVSDKHCQIYLGIVIVLISNLANDTFLPENFEIFFSCRYILQNIKQQKKNTRNKCRIFQSIQRYVQ